MSLSKEAEAVIALLDAVDAGIVQARRILGQPTQAKKPQFDPAKMKWEQRPGTAGGKGPYEASTEEANKDSPLDWNILAASLKESPEHHGGYLYWLFPDGKTIGRRKKEKQ